MSQTLMSPSTSAREQYLRDGFLCPVQFLSEEEISPYREAFNALELTEGRENATIKLLDRHDDQQFIWDLVTQPRLLDWIEALIGPDFLLLATHFFCKYPHQHPSKDDGHFVAWHQDVTYWGLEPAEAITAWIAIDDSNEENGCMEVIPASHKRGIFDHVTSSQPNNLLASNQAIPESELALETARKFELRAGQMSLHDGALAHASQPNLSNRRRCGLTARFITPNVKQVRPHNNKRKWWEPVLVRGTDGVGNFPNKPAPF